MYIEKSDFIAAVVKTGISRQQAEDLWNSLEGRSSKFNLQVFLYYFGALIVISAMTWFMNLGWGWFGSGGIVIIALVYAGVFTAVGAYLWNRRGLRIPAGLLITIAVCMTPLAIYHLENYFNIWPAEYPGKYDDFYSWLKQSWIFMELGTILVGLIALRFFPFPFLTLPIYLSGFLFTMDLFPNNTMQGGYWIPLCYGLLLLVIGSILDRRKKFDYGFWSYLFGALAFWISLTILTEDHGQFVLFLYLLVNILLMFFSLLLKRRILMVVGALGVAIYLSNLAYDIFKDSILFPFILSFIGLAIIYLGYLYQKNFGWIEKNIVQKLPLRLRTFFHLN